MSKITAVNWIVKLGFTYHKYRQGSAYVDGHERPDIVAHRNRFVDEMAEWKRQMEIYIGDEIEHVFSPNLLQGCLKFYSSRRMSAFYRIMMAVNGLARKLQERDETKGSGIPLCCSIFSVRVMVFFACLRAQLIRVQFRRRILQSSCILGSTGMIISPTMIWYDRESRCFAFSRSSIR